MDGRTAESPCRGHFRDRVMNKPRVEAFSDGVFAIAITLLVLTIAQPGAGAMQTSRHQLLERWPSLAAYAVSFLVIGIMWLNHHTVFSNLERIDRGLFYWNLLLLMTMVFIPYPTEVFGEALRLGHGTRTAAVFYSVAMTVNALMWSGLWLHASMGRRLLREGLPRVPTGRVDLPVHRGHAAVRGLDRGGTPRQRLPVPGLPRRSSPSTTPSTRSPGGWPTPPPIERAAMAVAQRPPMTAGVRHGP